MVFSASSVEALLADEASYTVFLRQLLFAVLGAVAAGLASRLDVRWWKRLAFPTIIVSVLLLAAVIPFGKSVNGNRNWLALGPVQFQPAEFAKVGLVLVGARRSSPTSPRGWRACCTSCCPTSCPSPPIVIGLILAGHDLGTAMVVLVIVAAVLLVAGRPEARLRPRGRLLAALGVALMVTGSNNRTSRIANWLDPTCQADPDGWCGQSVHGLYALADGGWWGVGLGASKEKWEWLSEAHNDFIFAIIGEELGLPGTLMILLLFGILAWACFRLVSRTQDRFVRIARLRHHGVAARSGHHQHRRRHRALPRHRRPAAARLRRRVLARDDPARPRHPAVLRAQRAGLQGPARRPPESRPSVARGAPVPRPRPSRNVAEVGDPTVLAHLRPARRGRQRRPRVAAARPR